MRDEVKDMLAKKKPWGKPKIAKPSKCTEKKTKDDLKKTLQKQKLKDAMMKTKQKMKE